MALHSLRRGFVLLAILALSCDRDDTFRERKQFTYSFYLGDQLTQGKGVFVFSDPGGNIVWSQSLEQPGYHTISFDGNADEVYSLTICGSSSLETFAFLPEGEYRLDGFWFYDEPAQQFYHYFDIDASLPSYVRAGGEFILPEYRLADAHDIAIMEEDKSDYYCYWNEGSATKYLYYPEITSGSTTVLRASDYLYAPSAPEIPVEFDDGFIILDGSAHPHDSVFSYPLVADSYELGVKNPYRIPEVIIQKLKTYHLRVSGKDYYYDVVTDELPTKQKKISATSDMLSYKNGELRYSVNGDATALLFAGRGFGILWDVCAPLGSNVKFRLPKFDQTFKEEYNFTKIDSIDFQWVNIVKDSRASSYDEHVCLQINWATTIEPREQREIIMNNVKF